MNKNSDLDTVLRCFRAAVPMTDRQEQEAISLLRLEFCGSRLYIGKGPVTADRDHAIFQEIQRGERQIDIARRYRISRGRVSQIIKKYSENNR